MKQFNILKSNIEKNNHLNWHLHVQTHQLTWNALEVASEVAGKPIEDIEEKKNAHDQNVTCLEIQKAKLILQVYFHISL